MKKSKKQKMNNLICFPARARAFSWLSSVTGLQSKRDKNNCSKSSFVQTSSMNKGKMFHAGMWLKQQSMKSEGKCDCNVSKASSRPDRSAISSHSALRSSTECSLRTCQCTLQQRLPEVRFVGQRRHFAVL